MAQGTFSIDRQPGRRRSPMNWSGKTRGLNNPRTLEAAIRSGEITKAEFENFAHRPRLDRLRTAIRVYGDIWGPLVPVDQERRQKTCEYLRTQCENLCELILKNRVEEQEFRLFDEDELKAEADPE